MKSVVAVATVLFATSMQGRAQQQTDAPAGIAMPPAAVAPADPAVTGIAPESHVFRVHVVDGRNGDSIAGARVLLWYDEQAGPGYSIASGAHGEALMPKPVGEPIRVLVSVNGYTDCRRPDRDAPPEGYNLNKIAEAGMAAQNTCGRVAIRTGPGELVVYVRPSHWYENLNKNPS